jgi:cell wall-associated NlpC family hydrolase
MFALRSVVATIVFVALTGQAGAVAPSPEASCVGAALDALLAPSLIDELSASGGLEPQSQAQGATNKVEDPRRLLVEFALQLRDVRYRRGGRVPATGFDCSGFVHYVFASVLGIDLPNDSASQFGSGQKIARPDMQAGDLVFFHTRGKRVSHVGIYIGDGQFIHAPTTGERVRVNSLSQSYWARRFAGARRPQTTA